MTTRGVTTFIVATLACGWLSMRIPLLETNLVEIGKHTHRTCMHSKIFAWICLYLSLCQWPAGSIQQFLLVVQVNTHLAVVVSFNISLMAFQLYSILLFFLLFLLFYCFNIFIQYFPLPRCCSTISILRIYVFS